MEKKTWMKPEPISLTRCKPQESLLTLCKWHSSSGDPVLNCTGCQQEVSNPCQDCSALGIS